MASFVMWVLTSLGAATLYVARKMELLNVPMWGIWTTLGVSFFFFWVMCLVINGSLRRYDKRDTDTFSWVVAIGFAILTEMYAEDHYAEVAIPVAIMGITLLLLLGFITFCSMLHTFRSRIGRILKCRKSVKDNCLWLMLFAVILLIAIGLFHHSDYELFKLMMIVFIGVDYILFCRIFYNYFIDLKCVERLKMRHILYHKT